MSGSGDSAAGPRPPGGAAPPPSDAELTLLLRRGYGAGEADPAVCALLYRRHRRAALAYARTCCRSPQDAEDLVSEAFLRTFQAVRAGAGPRGPWRSYLLSVVRHTAIQWRDGAGRTLLTSDFDTWRQPGPIGGDPQQQWVAGEDRRLVARSFAGLPERWRLVLWHTLVEEGSPHKVAALLGITPSAVTSLAFRAREGLREAYLRAHVEAAADGRCRHYAGLLGPAVRRGGTRLSRELARHLAECGSCARAYTELLDLNSTMRGAVSAPFAAR
ncbi:RNA polymerase sigma factor [Streptomyces sp. H27-S2]|uniref:RNA polymerase sigma factor n=1 Tax=Streptomyces antarcticus TaxID=2996458 RepID=UPI00226F148A|nr:sigma-70 family RNA polymerase sigma factor [Streptomyces sp. H27-S2]MCY0952024.1 sigma-70 family RNA polymerase sigma factor [Streptomyces sp. H27-S2]